MKNKKIIFYLIFLFAFFSLSYSVYSALLPEKTTYMFSYGNLLGIIKNDRITLLDVSKIKEGIALNIYTYNLRKSTGTPLIINQEIIAPVEGGIVFLSPNLKERSFIELNERIYGLKEYNENVFVIGKNNLYLIKKANFPEEKYEIYIEKSYGEKEVYSRDVEIIGNYLYVLVNDKIKVLDIESNLSIVKEIFVGENLGDLIKVGDYVVFSDISGNVYKYSYSKDLWKVGFFPNIFKIKRVGSDLIIFSTDGRVYLFSDVYGLPGRLGRPITYYLGDAFFLDAFKFENKYIIIGRKSIYVVEKRNEYPLIEKELNPNIISAVYLGEKLFVLTNNNEIYLFEKEDLEKGCYIIKPTDFETIGYIDVDVLVRATSTPSLYFSQKKLELEKEGDIYSTKINPEDYEFGKIKVECYIENKNEQKAKATIFREEDGPIGRFLVDLKDSYEEGETINFTVKNQYGEVVEDFRLIIGKKTITQNPVEISLSPGEYDIIIEKRGYLRYNKKVLIREKPLTTALKILGVLLITSVILYVLYIKGILSNFWERIRKRIEK